MPIEAASGLDLNDAWSPDHTGDKVALHLQRVYLSVVLGMASLGKQISRLRSWKETCRTSIFCGVRWKQVHQRLITSKQEVY
jgi:hypothetical protein